MNDIFSILQSLSLPKDSTIFEIGAANGDDTIQIIKESGFQNGRYFAFEPDPRNISEFKSQPWFGGSKAKLIEAAIGDRNMQVEFNMSGGYNQNLKREHTYSGSVKNPKLHLDVHTWCRFDEKIMVPMVRLDDFCNLFSVGDIDFIWCDIQGAEDLMIAGGKVALGRTRYLYTEYSDKELYEGQIGCDEIVSRLGPSWSIVQRWDNDVLLSRNQ